MFIEVDQRLFQHFVDFAASGFLFLIGIGRIE